MKIHVAHVVVRYETVELPDRCWRCDAPFDLPTYLTQVGMVGQARMGHLGDGFVDDGKASEKWTNDGLEVFGIFYYCASCKTAVAFGSFVEDFNVPDQDV